MNRLIRVTTVESTEKILYLDEADIIAAVPATDNPNFTRITCAEGQHYIVQESISQLIAQLKGHRD